MYQQIQANKRKTTILITIFFIIVMAIGWFLGSYLDYGYGIFLFAVVFSMGSSIFGFYAGDKIALKSSGAKLIDKNDNAYLYRMVENLCITAGMPMPKVHIINSPALNAFATGRDPEHASIAVTTGLMSALENEELEGVIAHELSHIQNYDIRVMTIVVVLVGTLALIADMFWRVSFFGGKSDRDSKGGGILMIIGIILILVSPLVANMIKMAVSRKREYLADASGALLTRYPEGLARALEKISASPAKLETASAATAHMFISNPFKNKSFSKYFSTHPPAEDRIKKLRSM
jgi:heat shock protein HtpX